MSINIIALRQQAEAARGVNLTRGKGKHLPLSMSPEGAIELCDMFVAMEARVVEALHHNADAWEAANALKVLQAAAEKRAADLLDVNEHLRGQNVELRAVNRRVNDERDRLASQVDDLQQRDACKDGRISLLERAVAKALDACFCDDGRGLPECANCQALRAVLPAPVAPVVEPAK